MAVMATITMTPRRSNPLLRAASTPLVAKTATPQGRGNKESYGIPLCRTDWRLAAPPLLDRNSIIVDSGAQKSRRSRSTRSGARCRQIGASAHVDLLAPALWLTNPEQIRSLTWRTREPAD